MQTLERETKALIGAIAAFSALGSAAATYIVVQRKFERLYDERLAQETENLRRVYAVREKKDEFATPEDAAEALGIPTDDGVVIYPKDEDEVLLKAPEALDPDKYKIDYDDVPGGVRVRRSPVQEVTSDPLDTPEVDPPEDVARNAFADNQTINAEYDEDGDFDHEEEMRNRDPNVPYVISHSEFVANPDNHEQDELTYYPHEDILIGDDSEPVPDIDDTIGEDNLTRFGHGSNDPNIVYIRNERISTDFTVVKSKGSFNKEVFGFIEHSEMDRRPRKFRGDRE